VRQRIVKCKNCDWRGQDGQCRPKCPKYRSNQMKTVEWQDKKTGPKREDREGKDG